MPTNDTPRTDEQRNVMLAKAIGWKPDSDTYHEVWQDKDGETVCMDSSDWAAQSHDAFHAHVVPVLGKRGKLGKWAWEVARSVDADDCIASVKGAPPHHVVNRGDLAFCLTADLDIWCDAAIEVLKGQNDE